jgi:rRNA maturation protein Nop10
MEPSTLICWGLFIYLKIKFMATIDIPDKICPHCGGTKWKTEYRKKPTKADPDKKLIRYRCAVKGKERLDRWSENNPDRWKNYPKRKKPEGYYKTPERREQARLKAKKESDNLEDNFIYRMILTRHHKDELKRSDIPQKLIDLKRKQLLLTRQLKQLEK